MTEMSVSVVDHGVGNLKSVVNALKHCGYRINLVKTETEILDAECIVLPGVGNFGGVVDAVSKLGIVDALKNYALDDRPFLGICVGMQLLFQGSEESPGARGLGVFEGSLAKLTSLEPNAITPSIGWRTLDYVSGESLSPTLGEAYFVHNYYATNTQEQNVVSSYFWHGHKIPAHVAIGRTHGVQFHPEKSRLEGVEFMGRLISQITS